MKEANIRLIDPIKIKSIKGKEMMLIRISYKI
jgi:hypothetical protein